MGRVRARKRGLAEPLETIEHNNELVRLLDEEQAEVHRILVAMTRAVAAQSEALSLGAAILAEADAHQGLAKFAEDLDCVRPLFGDERVDVEEWSGLGKTVRRDTGELARFL